MANQEHLNILKRGVDIWNTWREHHQEIKPDLSGANLRGADLSIADLRGANLSRDDLSEANLSFADLNEAYLSRTNLSFAELFQTHLNETHLYEANLSGADLRGADLSLANLNKANFSGADLSGAVLTRTILIQTNLTNATLKNCLIYGISAWDVLSEGAVQESLVITDRNRDQPTITVDNLKVAQFIYLLLNNEEIRDVIDTIAKKAVLILGRFTPERKAVLDALRDELRLKGYLPIVFDFQKPANRDLTETVSTLAHLSLFVIADITDAKSISQELMRIVPILPSVPIQPLILTSQHEYGMFEHFTRYPWVLPVYHYTDQASLLQALKQNVIAPAENKARDLASEKVKRLE
jgi:uncharacterized protein YjbI with pentapeptide repeats